MCFLEDIRFQVNVKGYESICAMYDALRARGTQHIYERYPPVDLINVFETASECSGSKLFAFGLRA